MDSHWNRLSSCRRKGTDQRTMITKSYSGGTSSSIPALVMERKLLKEAEEEERGKKTLGIGEDCSFCIFLFLPIDALLRASCVCKPWSTIIRNPSFVESHLHCSDTVLLCLASDEEDAKNFSVESRLLEQQQSTIFRRELPGFRRRQSYLHFLEIKDGISVADLKSFNAGCGGAVLASCNGLILLQNTLKKGLIVMNPVTRKLAALPAGTIVHPHKESYGFAFKSSTKNHIVVHLIQEDSGYISCEVLAVEKKKWAMVSGPPSGAITAFGSKPVFANGALHWLPAHGDWILWMSIEDEKFSMIFLPESRGQHDGIVEMGGFLCFVSHELNQIDVWALEGSAADSWTRRHTISSSVLPDMSPVSGSRQGRWMVLRSNLVFEDEAEEANDGEDEDEAEEGEEGIDGGGEVRSLYVYDFHLQVMSKVRTKHFPPMFHGFLPHVNSLLRCDLQSQVFGYKFGVKGEFRF